eukprot:326363-Prorocentrum_minimum.AAC.2
MPRIFRRRPKSAKRRKPTQAARSDPKRVLLAAVRTRHSPTIRSDPIRSDPIRWSRGAGGGRLCDWSDAARRVVLATYRERVGSRMLNKKWSA